MMFTESRHSVRLTEDLILSRKIVDLNGRLSDAPRNFSPLTCVGQWISIASEKCSTLDIEAIFATPEGHVVIISSDDLSECNITPFIAEIMSWDCSTLDRIAADFTFNTLGQAFTVCDLLAKHGHIAFSQCDNIATRVTDCLQSGSFSLLCFSKKAKRQ